MEVGALGEVEVRAGGAEDVAAGGAEDVAAGGAEDVAAGGAEDVARGGAQVGDVAAGVTADGLAMNAAAQREIIRLSRAQNGAITVHQLLEVGLTHEAIKVRVQRGDLVRVFRGVYVVGDPALLPLARATAALLALGPEAVISHRSAAGIWRLTDHNPQKIDITVPSCSRRARPGLVLHHAVLDQCDVSTTSNIRLTTPARTLIDLAAHTSQTDLMHAFGEARAKRLIGDRKLEETLARAPGCHPGAAVVRKMLKVDRGSTYTRSRAEQTLRRLLREAELPQPLVNVQVHGYTVDFLWPEHKLIVEVDGYGTHGHRLAFERDRRRDQVHTANGYVVIRITWEQLLGEPLTVIARIAQALARRAA